MNKEKPNFKKLIPTLSHRERAKLSLNNVFSKPKLLTDEEEQMLVNTFVNQTKQQQEELERYLELTATRILLIPRFWIALQELKNKAAHLSAFYFQLALDTPLQMIERFVSVGTDTIEKPFLLEFLKKTSVLERKFDDAQKMEQLAFKEEAMLKNVVDAVFQDIEQLINMREALRRIGSIIGSPTYPDCFAKERFDDGVREMKMIQRRHNKMIFRTLKPSYHLKDFGFTREIKNLDDYIIKTPKIREELLGKYMNLANQTTIENNVKKCY